MLNETSSGALNRTWSVISAASLTAVIAISRVTAVLAALPSWIVKLTVRLAVDGFSELFS